ncbi:F-box protein FBXO6, putative [Plasmodium vivax]|nr:F-box protein FBXO6, putative [Plasmodium vivax]
MATSEDAVFSAKGRKRSLQWDGAFDKHARVGGVPHGVTTSGVGVEIGSSMGREIGGSTVSPIGGDIASPIDSLPGILRGPAAPPQQKARREGRLQSSDAVCNILSFMPFAQRWNCKLLSRSFYEAFHTKYAWDNIDVRFQNLDIFKINFVKSFDKHFVNTFSLFLSINENTRAEPTINLAINNFPRLRDLRLYCRKKNNSYIFEGVHPIVSSLLSGKGAVAQREVHTTGECPKEGDTPNDKHEHGDGDGKAPGMTSPRERRANRCSQSPVDLPDWDFELSDLFLYSRYYGQGEGARQNGGHVSGEGDGEMHNGEVHDARRSGEGAAQEADDPPESFLTIAARTHMWNAQRVQLENQFEHLERLVLDVKLRGDELLPFVGRMTNLKDIILSKLLYTDKLNRAQCITIFTCFIEKIKKNNIRVLQLGLFFTREYKPTDYLDSELFRKIVKDRRELTSHADKEEGDELIHVLHRNHLHSLYCLWSNDLFISFAMYERIRTFRNLKVWILPGWRALSLVKQ